MTRPDRLPIGAVVRTLADDRSNDWNHEAHEARAAVPRGIEGYVRRVSDSHGLCYLVLHIELGVEAWYNDGELERITERT